MHGHWSMDPDNLCAASADLPQGRTREALTLTVMDGLTSAAAAERLGISEGALKVARDRGLVQLRDRGAL